MSTSNAGKKFDGGKAPVEQGFMQYFPRAIEAVALISKYGAEKYSVPYADKNWERVENGKGRYGDGRSRHITGEHKDGPYDLESKHLHAAHAAWNAMVYLELVLRDGIPLVREEAGAGNWLPGSDDKDFVKELEKAIADVDPPVIPGLTHFCVNGNKTAPGYTMDCADCKERIKFQAVSKDSGPSSR